MTATLIHLADDAASTIRRILADDELAGLGLNRAKVRRTLASFRGDEIAASVFLKKYAFRDAGGQIAELALEEAKDRWAREMVRAEAMFAGERRPEPYFRELYDHFLPAGRQMFALGNTRVPKATLSNCYVTRIEEDSLEGIYGAAQRLAKTFSFGGGIGLCLGELRPIGAKVSNSAGQSTGAVSFLDLFSLTTGLIGQGGRRGALMVTLPVHHPDIEAFVDIKHNNADRVRFANLSVKLTDEFMRQVVDDGLFELRFDTPHESIRRTVRAKGLWDRIVRNARDSAEPGLLFWDRMVSDSTSECYPSMRIHSTNPCAELPLPAGSACCLGSLLLDRFVAEPFTERARFDFGLFAVMVSRGVRHLDNVVELNRGRHALAEQEMSAVQGRRIGLGITGLADMLAALGVRYDSDQALEIAAQVMSAKMDAEHRASIALSRERGPFPLFDPAIHYETGFCSRLPDDIRALGRAHGQRNIGLSTVAPNGSLSIIAQCSGGIEPVFALNYKRYVELGKERKEFVVRHPGLVRHMAAGGSDADARWPVAHKIDHWHRIRLQSVVQHWVDASISSTINLPKDVSAETVGGIYMEAWQAGLKGVTVYREGAREGILVTEEFARHAGTPMDTVIHEARAEAGDKFYIPVSYEDGDIRRPYQVFLVNYKSSENDRFAKLGNDLVRLLKDKGVDPARIQKYLDRSTTQLGKITRFLSLAMKTGHFGEAVGILGAHGTVGTLAAELYKIFRRSLAAQIVACHGCGGSNVRMEEGCMHCTDCGWSGCH